MELQISKYKRAEIVGGGFAAESAAAAAAAGIARPRGGFAAALRTTPRAQRGGARRLAGRR